MDWLDYVIHAGAGLTVDSTGNHTLTFNGTMAAASGGWLTFDGVDDTISIPDATDLDMATNMTILSFVKHDAVMTFRYHVKYDGSGGSRFQISGTTPRYTKKTIADYNYTAVTWDTTNGNFCGFTCASTSSSHFIDALAPFTRTISATNEINNSQMLIGSSQLSDGSPTSWNPIVLARTMYRNDVAHSSDFVRTMGENQTTPSTFATAGTPVAIGGATSLVINNTLHSHNGGALLLSQVHSIIINNALHSHSGGALLLSQVHGIIINNALHNHSSNNLTFNPIYSLALQNTNHGQVATNLALSQVHLLTLSNAVCSHGAPQLTLSTGTYSLAVQGAGHAQLVDIVTLIKNSQIIIGNNAHNSWSGSLHFLQQHFLNFVSSNHALSSDLLSVDIIFSTAFCGHSLNNDGILFLQNHNLTVSDLYHSQLSDQPYVRVPAGVWMDNAENSSSWSQAADSGATWVEKPALVKTWTKKS